MQFRKIHIRDPFILPYDGYYYMFGTPMEDFCGSKNGCWCMKSKDLVEWCEPLQCFDPPKNFWGTE